MNREQRRNEIKKNKKLSMKVLKEVESGAKDNAIHNTIIAMEASMVTVLHDKYGFGRKRCQTIIKAFTDQFECITGGVVSIDDLKKQIKDELGIIIGGD